MARTEAVIQAELTTINSALQELISGTKITKLQVGSGEFVRTYNFEQITYENLKAEQQQLIAELNSILSTEQGLTFRKMSSIPLAVEKLPRGW